MKRFLHAGEMYALFLRRIYTIFNICILLIATCFIKVYSQEKTNFIIEYKMSTAVPLPNSFWTHPFEIYEDGKVVVKTLEEYKGKPIILDFWSVACDMCVFNFPKLKTLHTKYKDDFTVLLVNSTKRDSFERIDLLFNRLDSTYHLPSIINDYALNSLFPHGPIPHYVWINKMGRIDAFTRWNYVTEDNIKALLDKENVK